MIGNLNNYVKLAWIVISSAQSHYDADVTTRRKRFHDFNAKYGKFLTLLVYNSQLSSTNLIISLYYLYRYHHNAVLQFPESSEDDEDTMSIYIVITSLVLSNKSFDDQSYTLKTWLNIITNTVQSAEGCGVSVDLKLLNSLECHFLSSLDYKLNFGGVFAATEFWRSFERNGVFRLPRGLLESYKGLVGSGGTQVSPSSLHLPVPCSAPVLPLTSFAMLTPASLPLLTPTSMMPACTSCTPQISSVNSPVSVSSERFSTCSPLTPLTPYDENNYWSGKRRRLYRNVLHKQASMAPPQTCPAYQTGYQTVYQTPYQNTYQNMYPCTPAVIQPDSSFWI